MQGQAIMSDTRPILVFDSGVGGLSVLAHIRRALPQAPIAYAADNAGYPYGIKSEAEIASRVPALLGRLAERYHPRLVVIACNTASTIALPYVRAALDLPIVGTVPAVKPAAAQSKTRTIGVLGTEATVRQPYVDRLVDEFASDCRVIRHGSSELVDLAEAKLRGKMPAPAAIQAALSGLFTQPGGAEIDAIVLSCTHFPLLADEIRAVAGPKVHLVESGEGIARRTAFLCATDTWPESASGRAIFTGRGGDVDALAPVLPNFGLTQIDYL